MMNASSANSRVYHFLKIKSDIEEKSFSGIEIRKMKPEDWLELFGIAIQKKSDNSFSIERKKSGLLSNAPNFSLDDIENLSLIHSTHLLAYEPSEVKISILDFDSAIRLIKFGQSGISNGYSESMHKYMHTRPGWNMLPITEIMNADFDGLLELTARIKTSQGKKNKILVDRYKNAIQKSSSIQDHNRFLDLTTILEIIFVPDGGAGEISYKLRMRAGKILHKEFGCEFQDAVDVLRKLYSQRSKIVHSGSAEIISVQDWKNLVNLARLGINKYISEPEIFDRGDVDSHFFG